MVAPITGPYTSEDGGSGADDKLYYSNKVGYRQAKPYSEPLFYRRHIGQVLYKVGTLGGGARRGGTQATFDATDFTQVINKSYDRLVDKLKEPAEWAVGLAQINQSWSMIANRSMQLMYAARSVRRFQFKNAARALRLAVLPDGVNKAKSFGANWLEFAYGWSPLAGDIAAAVEILQNPILPITVTGSATRSYPTGDISPPVYIERPDAFNDWSEFSFTDTYAVPKVTCKQGCQVEVTNPNLWLANQLGFVNPASFLWELVPYSFVVDWFANVGQFVGSATDFYGLTVRRPWTVRHVRLWLDYDFQRTYRWWVPGTYYPNDHYWYSTETHRVVSVGVHTVRTLGLSTPILAIRPYQPPSWRRAANAISLLTQALR